MKKTVGIFLFTLILAIAGIMFASGVMAQSAVPPDETSSFIKELIDALLSNSAGLSGWSTLVGILGTIVMFVVRGFKIFYFEKWQSLKPIWKVIIPFACSGIGTLVIGLAVAMSSGMAVKSILGKLVALAIGAAVTSIAGHDGTKAVGDTVDTMLLKSNPDYVPGSLRKKMSLLVDMPKIDSINIETK